MNEAPTPSREPTDDLIAMIAHDLRSPITAIKGFSQLALRLPDVTPQVRNCLTVTITEANRIASLIDDLVLLSEFEHQAPLELQKADLTTIARAAISRSMRLDTTGEPVVEDVTEDVTAWCDPAVTERALVLLIGAARKYCARGGTIAVRVHRAEDAVVIAVLPHGNVSREKLPALRRAMGDTRVQASNELSASGLGLYICRRLIEKQDGRIWMDQVPGGCAEFMIVLPARSTRH